MVLEIWPNDSLDFLCVCCHAPFSFLFLLIWKISLCLLFSLDKDFSIWNKFPDTLWGTTSVKNLAIQKMCQYNIHNNCVKFTTKISDWTCEQNGRSACGFKFVPYNWVKIIAIQGHSKEMTTQYMIVHHACIHFLQRDTQVGTQGHDW